VKDPRVRLDTGSPLYLELRRRIDAHLAEPGRLAWGYRTIQRKTAILFATLGLGMAIGLSTTAWPVVLVGAVIVGLAMAGLGMAVQHDGGHRAYSADPRVNRAAAAVLDLLGASSHVWHHKHGIAHHTYPNIEGADEDIELRPLARMAPGQPHRWFHRAQHLYMPVLYGMLNFKWYWWDDYGDLLRGTIGHTAIRRPRGREGAVFWGGKLAHLLWALVLPIAVLGWPLGLLMYGVMSVVCGFVLSLVFQLAHCVEEAEFLAIAKDSAGQPLHVEFAAHQIATTVDFAPGLRWLSWYVGGLNFQAVHHLFPRVCHVHYPQLAPIIAECCREHGVAYRSTASLARAIGSHFRWLRRMGRGERVAVLTPAVAP